MISFLERGAAEGSPLKGAIWPVWGAMQQEGIARGVRCCGDRPSLVSLKQSLAVVR